MNDVFKRVLKVSVIVLLIGFIGCASVPPEVVTLSDTLGKDLVAVHVSYKQLIKEYYHNLRKQAEDFIDNKWAPAYLESFIKKTDLGQKITQFTPEQVLKYLRKWTQVAVNRIQAKKDELVEPIRKDEINLLAYIDDVFGRLKNANAAITAELLSIRKVKGLQDKALSALGLEGFRDKLTNLMANSSNKLQTLIDDLKKAENVVDSVDKEKNEIIKKAKEAKGLLKKKKDKKDGGNK
jgi:hypothetical protein